MRRVAVAMSLSSSGEWTEPFAVQRHAEEAQDDAGGSVHQAHEGAGHADDDIHGTGYRKGDALRALKGEGFGDKLAKDDFEVDDAEQGNDDGSRVRIEDGMRGPVRPSSGRRVPSSISATAGSPSQPSASEARVTPNCTAGRNSSMFRLSCRAVRAPGRPSASSCSMRVSRTLISANSAATKKLLARIKMATMTARKNIHSNIPC